MSQTYCDESPYKVIQEYCQHHKKRKYASLKNSLHFIPMGKKKHMEKWRNIPDTRAPFMQDWTNVEPA